MIAAKARHLQRIGHAAASFQRKVLQIAIHVVVRHEYGVVLLEQSGGTGLQLRTLIPIQRRGHLGPGVGRASGARGVLQVVVKGDGFFDHGRNSNADAKKPGEPGFCMQR